MIDLLRNIFIDVGATLLGAGMIGMTTHFYAKILGKEIEHILAIGTFVTLVGLTLLTLSAFLLFD